MKRLMIALLFVMALLPAPVQAETGVDPVWPAMAPEEAGFDSVRLGEVLLDIQQNVPNVHSLLVLRDGQLMLDASFYPYDGRTPHELASVTKSVMTTLIGIAIDQGRLELDQPIISFFPNRTIANPGDGKEQVTVEHLASTMSGLDCAADPDEPTLDEMRAADDWIQFALDRPMVAEPGARWEYCSPDFHLLSAILTSATGMTALDFAWEFLFGPLGMREVIWPADPQGYTHGWGDLYLYTQDAAKLGQLWLNGGEWNGQQIVSSAWVEDSVTSRAETSDDEKNYGLGWWIERESDVGGEFNAVGRGGQYIVVYPALKFVVVVTGNGNYGSGEITDRLGAALANPTGSIEPNPGGVEQLNEIVAGLTDSPAPQPVAAEPAMAAEISGVTYEFDPNLLELASFRIVFDGSDEALLTLTFPDAYALTGAVGLDGLFRFTPYDYGFPLGLRGSWTADDTFTLEYDEVANRDAFLIEVRFTSETVLFSARERTHASGVEIEGTAAT